MKRWPWLLLLSLLLPACGGRSDYRNVDLVEAARVNTSLGIDYMRKGQVEQAMEKLKRAVEQNPDYAPAHTALAFVYSRAGDPENAEKEYRKALTLDSGNPDTRNTYGVFLCGKGKVAEAERNFLEAAQDKKYKTPEAAWTNAGVCVRKTDLEKAERYFRQALERNREFPDALAQMGWLCYQKKDYWCARAFLQRYETFGRPTAETLWIGMQTERALGDDDAAERYERRLRTDFPESDEAANLRKTKAEQK